MTNETYLGLTLYPERDARLSALGKDLLGGFYVGRGETIQQAFARPAVAFCGGDMQLAQDIYNDVSRGWAMYSSPVLSNAPLPGEKAKAMPIACFLGYVPDTRYGLVDHQEELAWLSMMGGGFGGHWDDVRAISDKSVGPIPHMGVSNASVEAFRQGKTRKGSYAAYLDVSHPDIVEFINIRMPTGGDVSRKLFNIHHAVNITDNFMEAVYADANWDLVCPSSGRISDTVSARGLWESIIETRYKTGEPYLNFIDTANESLPESQRKLGLKIHGSNLCNEIHLPTGRDRTAVCCLSSVNLELFHEWKHDEQFIKRWVRFLDNVLQFFIDNAPSVLHKAVYSASRERAIGLGAMGFHSLLQSMNIPWESAMAKSINLKVSRYIKDKALEATYELGAERGEAPDMEGTGRRNSHLLAIAPNANSGLICGTSPSIEPLRSNAFTQRTRAGSHFVKNPHLARILELKAPSSMLHLLGKSVEEWLDEQWQSILLNDGSVQHLDYLDEWEKDVFKTSFEIDQEWVVSHAADRQQFICQGQSVNLYLPFGAAKSYVNKVHLLAHKLKLKGLYYLRTTSGAAVEKVSQKIERVALKDFSKEEGTCLSCQG